MTVKQKDNQGGESSKEVRFSKYTDDDKVVVLSLIHILLEYASNDI